jgi:hypothetical protein
VSFAKLGCAAAGVLAIALLVLFAWPYRSEEIKGVVTANATACTISANSYGGWREEQLAAGVHVSRVAYPLKIYVFVDDCRGVPQSRPYSAQLISLHSGSIVARGLACGDHRERDLPCRIELPPLATLDGQDRYVVRVVRVPGAKADIAKLNLTLHREWRSVAFDTIMSV